MCPQAILIVFKAEIKFKVKFEIKIDIKGTE